MIPEFCVGYEKYAFDLGSESFDFLHTKQVCRKSEVIQILRNLIVAETFRNVHGMQFTLLCVQKHKYQLMHINEKSHVSSDYMVNISTNKTMSFYV